MPGSGLVQTAATGVYMSTGHFEAVVRGLSSSFTTLAAVGPERSWRVPPVIARSVIEKVGYHNSFPHLLGRVFVRASAGMAAESDLVLLPAACYSVYPAYEGSRLKGPVDLSVEATCFRHEDSAEIGRLRSFRMRELVRLGTADECRTWRDRRLAETREWLGELGLTTQAVVASDPFFGSGSRLMRMLQVEQELKIELVAAVGPGLSQAIASGNYHKDQFGQVFAISDFDSRAAHTACVAIGYERLALALLHRHGGDPRAWPDPVKTALRLEALA